MCIRDRLFTYRVPREMEGTLRPGCRVMVPFGAGNRKRQGMVFALAEAAEDATLKPVSAQLDENPVLSAELLALSKHLRDTVFCTYYEAVRLMVPAALDTKVEHSYALNPDWEEDGALRADESLVLGYLAHRRAPAREKAVCDALGFADERVLRALYAVSYTHLRSLSARSTRRQWKTPWRAGRTTPTTASSSRRWATGSFSARGAISISRSPPRRT